MKKISLNQNWQFAKGTITMMELMMGEAGNIENIDLPHDAMIYQERTPATANAHQTGFYPGGEYTYMKKWEIPEAWKGCTVVLEFEGVADTLPHLYERGSCNRACESIYRHFCRRQRLSEVWTGK